MADSKIIAIHEVQSRILILRGERVLLDEDIAAFFGVSTKALNQAVSRNLVRFPADFRFTLTHEEFANLKSQSVTSSWTHGGRRKRPAVFTEHGILMAATVLNSARAVQMSIVIVRTFSALRRMVVAQEELAEKLMELESRVGVHDEEIAGIVQAIRHLAAPPGADHDRKIGFHSENR